MKIVIDIPEQAYEVIKRNEVGAHAHNLALLTKWIADGTPLPPGHGRLIDESKIDYLDDDSERPFTFKDRIKNTSETIIEADEEGA